MKLLLEDKNFKKYKRELAKSLKNFDITMDNIEIKAVPVKIGYKAVINITGEVKVYGKKIIKWWE